MAHPYYERDDTPILQKLNKFLDIGISGVECYHPNHDKFIIEECLKWCSKNKVISTAGSDFHGGFIESRRMGRLEARIKDVNLGSLINFIVI